MRGADAMSVAVAKQLGALLVTWDEEMLERAGLDVAVVSPTT